jgi:hypothetical protein
MGGAAVTYEIHLRCEGTGVASGCGYFGWRVDRLDEPVPAETLQDMSDHGWAERDGKFYCPRHNPELAGQHVYIGLHYVEVAAGVWVRHPCAQREDDSIPIEVRVIKPGDGLNTADSVRDLEDPMRAHAKQAAEKIRARVAEDQRIAHAVEDSSAPFDGQ